MREKTGATVTVAPEARKASPAAVPSWKSRRLPRRAVVLSLLVTAAALLFWSVAAPRISEWRWSRSSTSALLKEAERRKDDPRFLRHLGLRLNREGRFAEADPLLRLAVGYDPDSAELRDEWTKALLGNGLTTAAFGQLNEFATTHPRSASAWFLLGKFYFTQRSMKRAAEELEKAVALDPAHAEAWAFLSEAYQTQGDLTRGLPAAEKAASLRPKDAGKHLLLGTMLSRANRAGEARQAYERAVALEPGNAVARLELARFLLDTAGGNAGDMERAEKEARQSVALLPEDAGAHLTLGRALLQGQKQGEAVDPLRRAATLAPQDPASALALKQAYSHLGYRAEAQRWEREYLARQKAFTERATLYDAVRTDPNNAEKRRKLARVLARGGDVEGAVRHHAAALRSALDAPPTLIAAANDLIGAGRAADALPLARRAVVVGRASPAAFEALGNALLGVGKPQEAAVAYDKAVLLDPKRYEGLRKKVETYYAAQDKAETASMTPAERAYREARRLQAMQVGPKTITPDVDRLARRAVELEPKNTRYLRYLLDIEIGQRHPEKAVVIARRLVAQEPGDARAHALLAVLLADKASTASDFAEVETHLKLAGSDPATAGTRHYAAGLLALNRRQGDTAVRELREAVRLDPDTEVTYYKLARAERLAGNVAAAEAAMKIFRERQSIKRQQAEVLGDIANKPNQPGLYERAASVFEKQGLTDQAAAIRAEARRRFGSAESKTLPAKAAPRPPGTVSAAAASADRKSAAAER